MSSVHRDPAALGRDPGVRPSSWCRTFSAQLGPHATYDKRLHGMRSGFVECCISCLLMQLFHVGTTVWLHHCQSVQTDKRPAVIEQLPPPPLRNFPLLQTHFTSISNVSELFQCSVCAGKGALNREPVASRGRCLTLLDDWTGPASLESCFILPNGVGWMDVASARLPMTRWKAGSRTAGWETCCSVPVNR